jgi:hypothetical protein
MIEKLKSRKLWVAVLSTVLITINDQMGNPVAPNTVVFLTATLGSYILGQSAVDVVDRLKK